MIPRTWRAAVFITAALCFAVAPAASAHDPGLSALELRVDADRIVATLSVAAVDATVPLAIDAIELQVDGIPLIATDSTRTVNESGTSLAATFTRPAGVTLTVRSAVPVMLALGHRQLLTIHRADGARIGESMLDARSNTATIDLEVAPPRGSAVAGRFFELGIHHIIGGYDHLLFLAALLLGVRRMRDVVKTITAFTVAHSLTLALTVLGLVNAPPAIVEPVIAASIVWVGLENLFRRRIDARWKLTFAFGLVHGFGFAGALRELGIGTDGAGIAIPLASFNLGVEAGQIGVAMVVCPLIAQLNARPWLRARLAPVCSLLVVAAGSYWLAERTLF